MSKNDGILKDLFFAIGVATVAVGSAYLIGKMVKSKLNSESEMIVGGDCICSDKEEDDTNTEDDSIFEGFDDDENASEDEI